MLKEHISLYLSKTNKETLLFQIPQNYKDYLYIPIEVEFDVHQLYSFNEKKNIYILLLQFI